MSEFQRVVVWMVCLSYNCGALYPVNVDFHDGQLHVNCYRFDQIDDWNQGSVVCGKSKLFLSGIRWRVLFFYLSQPAT